MPGPARKRQDPERDKALRRENHALRRRLAEAEQTLHAIRSGAVDAIVVTGPEGEQVFTLQGAERPYRILVEAMEAGAVTLGLDGIILYANNRFAEMVGGRLERLVGAPFERLVASDDLPAFRKLLMESRSGSSGDVSLRRDGDAIFLVHLALRFLDVADVQAVCMVVADLTEHRRMEEARREAEERYRHLFQRSPVGVFRASLDLSTLQGSRLEVNEAYVRLFGYRSPEEAVADEVTRMFFPGEWERHIHDLAKKRVLSGYEVRFQRLDGAPIWALMNVALTDQGDGTALVEGTILDITERKQAEDALRRLPEVLEQTIKERTVKLQQAIEQLEEEVAERQRAEAALRLSATLPEQSPFPVLRISGDGVVLYANPASQILLESWGIEQGKPLPLAARRELLEPLATGSGKEIEMQCGERVFTLLCWPFREDGCLNLYGRDITQQKQTRERQERLVNDLALVNRELNEFAYVVSHDLKAPLRAITSLAGWLRRDYADKLGEEGASQLALLEGRAKRLNALIDGVLEYSRVGRATEKKSVVDLDQLVAEVIDLLSPPASVHVGVIGVLSKVTAARVPLQQVFQNLLQNAIKFSDKPEVQIRIACAPIPGFWEIIVTDNGPGIPERHFDKIFQMFRTLAPRDKVESTGIGLALAKKIVELHGGRIWVTSREGEGSSFHFTLPRGESPERDTPF